ncbi:MULTISPECIES: UDP-N-acetylmuramate dehydrogenase [unclassified Acinetobacter]|uniref:UDP-N-acetylmuramate dehydrogenase n=1 Tax=unclassified Acinetobacter TaxID=196816 RepID=UPI0035B9C8DD
MTDLNIQYDVDLTQKNTLALQCVASHYVQIQQISQIALAVEYAKQHHLNWVILSGGSNFLLPEKIHALVLDMAILGEEILTQDQDSVVVKAYAGQNWHQFVLDCCAKGYHGLENLALIPGKVGASPIQNIGAYGVEVGEFIQQIWAYDTAQQQDVIFDAADCQFAYRDSIFKQNAGRYVIYAVSFKLLKQAKLKINYADVAQRMGDEQTPEKLLQTIIAIRSEKLPQPSQYPNAGSFFKNPLISTQQFEQLQQKFPNMPHYPQSNGMQKIAAGWLIEQAGWKGKQLGKVGMFARQALVLVNYADASLSDVQNTYQQVQHDVQQQFAILLEPEPVLLNALGQVVSHHTCHQI